MNKLLLVEDIKNIKNGNYLIDLKKDSKIEIEGNTTLHLLDKTNNHLEIYIKPNSKLVLEELSILKKDMNISFYLEENSSLLFQLVVLNNKINHLNISVHLLGNQNNAKLIVRARNKEINSNLNLICNGYIKENTKDNELLEDLKGLILYENDTIKISPNMFVNINEVIASHLVTIGSFSPTDLFYLKSKGIDEKTAKNMLIKAFTTSILSEDLKELGGEELA